MEFNIKIVIGFLCVSLALTHTLPHENEDCDSTKKQDSMENNQHNAMDNQPPRNNLMENMNGQGHCEQGNPRDDPPKKIWTLGVGRAWPPFEELDTEKMQVVGFGVSMLEEACRVANQHCEFIAFKDYTDCWDNEKEFSRALSNNWFDACCNYNPTLESKLMYSFSNPYSKNPRTVLLTNPNDNVIFDDLRREDNEVSIGFTTAYYPSLECIKRFGVHVNEERMVHYPHPPAMREGLRNGEVRVVFDIDLATDLSLFKIMDTGNTRLQCTVGGVSAMVRKENQELLRWLNPALQQVMNSPFYKRECYIWEKIYGVSPDCFDSDRI